MIYQPAQHRRHELLGSMFFALAVMLLSTGPAAAIECQARPGDGSYWAWRQVEGRRCYYKGRRGIDKRLLSWAKAPVEAPPPPARAAVVPPPAPPVATLPPPPAPVAVPRAPRITEVPVRIVGAEPPPYVAAAPLAPPVAMPPEPLSKGPPLPQPRPAEADASDGWLLTIAVLILVIFASAGLFATGLLHLRRKGFTYAS